MGRKIWFLFKEKFADFKGFIVFDNQHMFSTQIHNYSIVNLKYIKDTDAIIVALNQANTKEVENKLSGQKNVFYL